MLSRRRSARTTLSLVIFLALAACGGDIEPSTDASASPAAYRDPSADPETRAADLLARMTLAEKIGQMTLVEKNSIEAAAVADRFIGGVLSGGGGTPATNSPEGWADMVDGFQEAALGTRLGIPILYGADGVHGHGNVRGAVIFPQQVGLGATRDPGLVEEIATVTASEMAATGVRWNYAPVVAVPQDIRWGRSYESYGEQTELVAELGAAFVRGLQGAELADVASALATPKHFVGDGGTSWGSATTNDYRIDQGVTDVDEETLRAVHLPPYEAAIEAGARSIMVSFSSWGDLRMHAQEFLIADVLKDELGFDGFVVSDWGGIDQISPDRYANVVTGVNAGIDMVMVPYDYQAFIADLTAAVEAGDVTVDRIDDAVERILRVKFELGLFEHPLAERGLLPEVGSEEHRELARRAVAASTVLLKNEQALPIGEGIDRILVAGRSADDIGIQCGGWTISWQGAPGPTTDGTTILEGIQARAGSASVTYDPGGGFEAAGAEPADVGIVVVGEEPYAEGVGDDPDPVLSDADLATIRSVRDRVDRLIVVLVTGRPLILGDALELADAVVVAWLPGTEAAGVADGLFGDAPFVGRLPYTWPRSVEQLPRGAGSGQPLFPYDFGLTIGP